MKYLEKRLLCHLGPEAPLQFSFPDLSSPAICPDYVYYAVKERIQSNVDTGLAGLDTRDRLFEELVEDTEVLSDLPPE